MLFWCVVVSGTCRSGRTGSDGAKWHWFLLLMFLHLPLITWLSLVLNGFAISTWSLPLLVGRWSSVSCVRAGLLGGKQCCLWLGGLLGPWLRQTSWGPGYGRPLGNQADWGWELEPQIFPRQTRLFSNYISVKVVWRERQNRREN